MAERELTWRKSSRSGDNGGGCIEVADDGALVLVRDSKGDHREILAVDRAGWREFLRSAQGIAS